MSNARPICPSCNLELVYVAIVLEGSGEFFRTWQCDCNYREKSKLVEDAPDEIVPAIVRAREGDEYSISYNWRKEEWNQ